MSEEDELRKLNKKMDEVISLLKKILSSSEGVEGQVTEVISAVESLKESITADK